MNDFLDPVSGYPSIDERILASMKHWLNSIKAMQGLMIDVRRPMGHDSSLEAENSPIERDHGRIVTADRYFEAAPRRSHTGDFGLECASNGKVSRNPCILDTSRGHESTGHGLEGSHRQYVTG